MYPRITIHVNYFEPGNFWNVEALADKDDSDGQPEELGNSERFDDETSAIEYAENQADWILLEKQAEQVTILKNGNEHATRFHTDPLPTEFIRLDGENSTSIATCLDSFRVYRILDKRGVELLIVRHAEDDNQSRKAWKLAWPQTTS